MELVRSAHSLGEANFHLQFTPKYRRDVFRDIGVKKGLRGELPRNSGSIRLRGPRHRVRPRAHPHIRGRMQEPILAVSELVRLLKGASSRRIRQKCWSRVRAKLWGNALTAGYFYRSVGATTNEAIKYYLEHSQRKHWKAVDHNIHLQSKQRPITEYVA